MLMMAAMIDWFDALMGMLVGLILGAAVLAVLAMYRQNRLVRQLDNAQGRAGLLDEQIQQTVRELDQARRNYAETDQLREEAQNKVTSLSEKLAAKDRAFDEKLKLLDDAKTAMSDAFKALSAQALDTSNKRFLTLADEKFKPINELMEKYSAAVREIETKREKAYTRLDEQIKQIAASHDKLGAETTRLTSALRRPEQRGRWGEMQLRNVVELAGMTEHCDFVEQPQTDDPTTQDRPDMIVTLPGGGVIVVDSKVALDAYLDALQPDVDRDAALERHARHVREHYKRLANKRYWDQFERTPKLAVMFMPLESALSAALDVQPDLHAEAMKHHVLIATPTLLVALLRAVAYGWQQEDVAANAREISDTGRELYDRIAKFVEHFEKVGSGLAKASNHYNNAIGSLERMVLPTSRKLKELHATTEAEIDSPAPIEIETRPVIASELRRLPQETTSREEA